MNSLYGKNAVFIFDPLDDSNRPLATAHENAYVFWPLYPDFLRRLFTRAFTAGMSDPLGSIGELDLHVLELDGHRLTGVHLEGDDSVLHGLRAVVD